MKHIESLLDAYARDATCVGDDPCTRDVTHIVAYRHVVDDYAYEAVASYCAPCARTLITSLASRESDTLLVLSCVSLGAIDLP